MPAHDGLGVREDVTRSDRDGRQGKEAVGAAWEKAERGVPPPDRGVLAIRDDGPDEFVDAFLLGIPRREETAVDRWNAVEGRRPVHLLIQPYARLDQSSVVGGQAGRKAFTRLPTRSSQPDGDRSGHPDRAQRLWHALYPSPNERECPVNPDVGIAGGWLSPVGAAKDQEALLELAPDRVEQLLAVVGTPLPVDEHRATGARAVPKLQTWRQESSNGVGAGLELDPDDIAREMPRRRRDERLLAR